MQATDTCTLRYVFTNCGGMCRGPQGNVDVEKDGHDAEGTNFDDEVYAAYGGGSDEIYVESFVDLLCGEGESQEQQVKI